MKFYLSACLYLLAFAGVAQDSIPRVPLIEVFTSSTCGPCRPGNEGIESAYFDDSSVKGRYAIVKYQMNWPGNGDPYYLVEGNGRRNFYGVNGVPDLYINGTTNIFPTSSLTNDELKTEMKRYSYMKITPHYTVTDGGKTFNVDVTCEALQELNPPASRLFIAIVENRTVKNVKSNGETEFKYVFKKMIPSGGEFVVGKWEKGKVFNFKDSYTFPGSYRLPGSAADPIDVSTENSVEDFDNLRVLAWVQDLGSKEVFNTAWGFVASDTTHEYHPLNPQNPLSPNFGKSVGIPIIESGTDDGIVVFPNPSQGIVNVQFLNDPSDVSLQVLDMQGRIVDANVVEQTAGNYRIDLSEESHGMYLLKIHSSAGVQTRTLVLE